MGTALNERHIEQIRKFVPRVVLVFDADAGGMGGVERALQLFVSQEVDLAVALLPEGMDPCDFILAHGGAAFQKRLIEAQDALEYTLTSAFTPERTSTVEGSRAAVEEVLKVIAQAPANPRQSLAIKQQLVMSRLAQRAGVREESLWQRLAELKHPQKNRPAAADGAQQETEDDQPRAPADPLERELVQALLAHPGLIKRARERISLDEVRHAGLRRVLHELYMMEEDGTPISLDHMRSRLADKPKLAEWVAKLHLHGTTRGQHSIWFEQILKGFDERQTAQRTSAVRNQLRSMSSQGPVPVDLLAELQKQTVRR